MKRSLYIHHRIEQPWAVLVISLLCCLVGAPNALASNNLEKCLEAEQEFDYQLVLAECAVAAQDNSLNQVDKIQVYRLLGVAHTALGDAGNAEFWFIKLLILDEQFTFSEDESPVYIEAFNQAKQKFQTEGNVVITHVAPVFTDGAWPETGPLPLQFDVKDTFGRVESASLKIEISHEGQLLAEEEVPLKRTSLNEQKSIRFDGTLDQPRAPSEPPPPYLTLQYTLVMTNAFGKTVVGNPVFEPVQLQIQTDSDGEGGSGLLWAGVGGVVVIGAGTVALMGAGGGIGIYCYVSGNCAGTPPPASPHSELEVSLNGVLKGY